VAVTNERRAPQIRCYECGSATVGAFCHHCWRAGCSRHVAQSPAWAVWLTGTEGSGPGLKSVRAAHCGDHAHVPAGIWLLTGASGLALAAVGLFAMLVSLVAGTFGLVIGAAMAFVVYARIRHRAARSQRSLPLALHPKVSQVQSLERLRTRITLDDLGHYRTRVDPVVGRLSAVLTYASPDRERVQAYLRKHRLPADQKVPYSAGRLVPQGPAAIRELKGKQVVNVSDGDAAAILGVGRENAPAACRYNIGLDYTLSTTPVIEAGPFWVTPSIAPESEKHTLEIDIQWTEFGPDDGNPIALDVINLLRVMAPVGWGRVKEISRGSAMVSPEAVLDEGAWFRAIEWKQFSPSQSERRRRQFTIAVQFENPIFEEDHLSGRLEATMRGALSGMTGIRMYNSLGRSRTVSDTPSVKTRIEADFTLSLASARYQAIRVFPNREDEETDSARFSVDFDVIPDDETIISVTNALAEEQFYVKRVTENPPRTGGRANVMNRFWNIAGRNYVGVHPIDFHLVITGEEVHKGDIRADSGNMKIHLSVSGAYTDDEMRIRVENTLTQLRQVVSEAVMKARRSTGHGPALD
jgi:hypothetical protein